NDHLFLTLARHKGPGGGSTMKDFKLRELIEDAVADLAENRPGSRPALLAKISPALPVVRWRDDRLPGVIKSFIYQAATASNSEAAVRIAVNERARLADLETFVRILPVCWIQLRVTGYGAGITAQVIEDLFREFAYRSEEWVGVEGSESQLAIFSP